MPRAQIPPHILIEARWKLWQWWRARRRHRRHLKAENKRWKKQGLSKDIYITYTPEDQR